MTRPESECKVGIIPPVQHTATDCGCSGTPKIWVLEYEVTGKGKGCAVCQAANALQAEMLLKSRGLYNGTPGLYRIHNIEEAIVPPCPDLMAEQVVTYKEVEGPGVE